MRQITCQPVNTSTETDLWTENETSGGYCGGVPPLPIPNREVKPTCADGTAMQCGRVGSRLLLLGAPRIQYSRGSFFVPAVFCNFVPSSLFNVLHCERENQSMSESLAICIKLHAVLTQIGVRFESDYMVKSVISSSGWGVWVSSPIFGLLQS